MVEEVNISTLQEQLFGSRHDVYAVVDGASLPGLLAKLEEHEPKNTCLFRGELPFDLAEAAPYLVKLEKENKFSNWLLDESLEEPCCIYAKTTVKDDFIQFRRHFRSFLRVESPEGKSLLFRYYDPRVMKTYLPICTVEDNDILFKDIDSYLLFNKGDKSLQSFKRPINSEIKEELAIEETRLESSVPGVAETDVNEEKTVMMRVKPVSQEKDNVIPEKAGGLPASQDTDVSEEKTVIMRIKPKQ